jgi:HlyD family secretion protein
MSHHLPHLSAPEPVKRSVCACKAHITKVFLLLPKPVQAFVLKHKWKLIIATAIIVPIVWGYLAVTKEPEPEYITAKVMRGTLVQTVEAVGTVTSERDLNLQFPISGVVAEVLVNEGDSVEAEMKLASLRAGDLQANVNSAYASLQAAQADLQELKEGTRPEDIAIAEAEVENKRATLEASRETLRSSEQKLEILEREADVSLSGYVTTARSVITQELTTSLSALTVVEDVFEDYDVQDALLKSDPGKVRLIENSLVSAEKSVQNVLREEVQFTDYQGALSALEFARSSASEVSDTLSYTFSALVSLKPTGAYTASERATHKASISTERESVQDSLNTLNTAVKNLRDESASYDTQIAIEQKTISTAKSDILKNETSLRTQEAQLALKKAGARQTDIDYAAAKVRQEQADLSRARSDFADSVLYAPVTGTITKVNIKTGELLSTAFQQDAAISMLGQSPYRIEMYVSEIDIPKVHLQQESSVELDAFSDEKIKLVVAEVDPAATDVDGVPKYRVKLDFTGDMPNLKIGMTGDVDIFTGESKDVLMVTARAIIENDQGDEVVRILKRNETIEERTVVTGLEGETDIEIISGLEEGEEIIVLIKK